MGIRVVGPESLADQTTCLTSGQALTPREGRRARSCLIRSSPTVPSRISRRRYAGKAEGWRRECPHPSCYLGWGGGLWDTEHLACFAHPGRFAGVLDLRPRRIYIEHPPPFFDVG